MPAPAGSYKTIAEGLYRLLLKSRVQSSFPMSQQQVNWEATSDPGRRYRKQFRCQHRPFHATPQGEQSPSSQWDHFP